MIARYLNFNDKNTVIQKFRTQRDLTIEGQSLLLFSDYSAEVSRKRKLFTPICATLFQNKIKFTLPFPAVLHLAAPDGRQYTFYTVEEIEPFMQDLTQKEYVQQQESIPNTPRNTPRINRQLLSSPYTPRGTPRGRQMDRGGGYNKNKNNRKK